MRIVCALLFATTFASAAIPQGPAKSKLVKQLNSIRGRVLEMQRSLVEDLQKTKEAQSNIKKIHALLVLQKQERELGQRRLKELQSTVVELESRKGILGEKILVERGQVRRFLISIESSIEGRNAKMDDQLNLPEAEKSESARRKVLSRLVDRELKDLEALKIDLSDDEQLEATIQDERQQLSYVFQETREQEGVLEMNRQLQTQIIKRQKMDHLAQLDNYRQLKMAEFQVERLIGEFNARKELEKNAQAERVSTRGAPLILQGAFARAKGHLPFPIVSAKVISAFGRVYDPKSSLYIFKKGIDLQAVAKSPVTAIHPGKIAYSGELPDYGRVTIVDHGDHFYSLCAHLGSLSRKAGDIVAAGDVIGSTDNSGTPVYFEIRARNVAVNPLQWISN